MNALPTHGAPEACRRHLADKLRAKLRDLDINQSDVARKLGTSRDNVSAWARGNSFPRPAMLEKLAEALDCDVADLVPGEIAPQGSTSTPYLDATCGPDGWCHLRVNARLPLDVVLQVMQLVKGAVQQD